MWSFLLIPAAFFLLVTAFLSYIRFKLSQRAELEIKSKELDKEAQKRNQLEVAFQESEERPRIVLYLIRSMWNQ